MQLTAQPIYNIPKNKTLGAGLQLSNILHIAHLKQLIHVIYRVYVQQWNIIALIIFHYWTQVSTQHERGFGHGPPCCQLQAGGLQVSIRCFANTAKHEIFTFLTHVTPKSQFSSGCLSGQVPRRCQLFFRKAVMYHCVQV